MRKYYAAMIVHSLLATKDQFIYIIVNLVDYY